MYIDRYVKIAFVKFAAFYLPPTLAMVWSSFLPSMLLKDSNQTEYNVT